MSHFFVNIADVVSLLSILAALIILMIGWRYNLQRNAKLLLVGFLGLLFFHNFSNVLEWFGITAALDTIEDYTGILVPVLWCFIFYAFLQEMSNNRLLTGEARFQSLVETGPSVVICLSSDYRILEFNGEAERVYGYKREEVLGKNYLEIFLPDDVQEEVATDIRKVLDGQPRRGFESSIKCADRTERIFMWNIDPLLDGSGHTTGVIAVGQDITEHKLAEEKLQESEKRFEDIANNALEWIWQVDAEGKYTYTNPVVEKILGYKPEEVLKKYFYDLFHPEDREELKKAALEVFDEKQPFREFVNRNVHKNGNEVWVLTSGVPILDERGQLLGYRGADIDITERKKTEHALQESENLIRQVLDATPNPIFAKDRDGRYIMVNKAVAELHDTTPGEMVGNTDLDFAHLYLASKQEAKRFLADDRMVIDSKKPKFITAETFTLPDGTIKWFQTTKIPMSLRGNPDCVLGVAVDITERKQAEEALEKLNKDLASTVQQLSWSNSQLRDFVHIAAHDLKTPLRGIGTLAHWLAVDYSDRFDERGQEQVKLLVDRVKRVDQLIDGMLRYSVIERNKSKEQQVDLNLLVAEAIRDIEAPEDIEMNIGDKLPKVVCEEELMIEVFKNLLANAVKYIDKANGRINVTCIEENNLWKFGVSDNGLGIEEQHFERIFKIFQTLSPKDDLGGIGVGLTIAKKIVEIYGGQIWVQSKLGEGTTVFFTLPKQRQELEDAKFEADITC